ncbi:MAG: glycosyl hydrolase, partial [Verrucomicrobia bacterium]|nr:glycosyl hydrolase [Verrucomicrobiota bacterium]
EVIEPLLKPGIDLDAEDPNEAYYRKFPEHFGTTIDSAFYDEPTFHWVQGGRAWTSGFNEEFRRVNGYDPVIYYPALWYDIGPETAAARNALFGMRAALYSTGFPKVLNDWCRAHRIQLTGHVDQEEVVNPVGLCGDLMKSFRHQDIPGIDQIGGYGRASKAYKIVSSAANNYDRPLVLTECYGAMDRLPVDNLYKEAMDQFAKGINVMVPHAVWYEPETIIFQPDLSPDSAAYGPHLAAFNRYIGRLQLMLQGGRHVADIAVLYPIATLQAGYYFGPGTPYEGGVIPPEADYMDLGERLALDVRRDFTFLHPETLDERCSVQGPMLRLNNRTNAEEYKVFIIPGSRAIHWSSLRKIKAFYDQGGIVVATTRLPDCSAEFGHDADVRKVVEEMFGSVAPAFPRVSASTAWKSGGYDAALAADGDLQTRWRAEKVDRFSALTTSKLRLCIDSISSDSASIAEFEAYDVAGRNMALAAADLSVRTNASGGRAYFMPAPRAAALRAVLNQAFPLGDVGFEQEVRVSGGNLTCLHKVAKGQDLYFFANSSNDRVDTFVRLRGRMQPEAWDPHTGLVSRPEISHPDGNTTRVRLVLEPVKSIFLGAPREPA